MLPTDPAADQGSAATARDRRADVLPAAAMAPGATIIRPGAIAWGGMSDAPDGAYPSCEGVEAAISALLKEAAQSAGSGMGGYGPESHEEALANRMEELIGELARTRLWVPLPAGPAPVTDGTAVLLPTVRTATADGGTAELVPCFTSVQRLNAWATRAFPGAVTDAGEYQFTGIGRRWQRAGDARMVPHIIVPSGGLALRLPEDTGLALNPDATPTVALDPDAVDLLAGTAAMAAGLDYEGGRTGSAVYGGGGAVM